jgi:putative ABC transport system substrate-binding protein
VKAVGSVLLAFIAIGLLAGPPGADGQSPSPPRLIAFLSGDTSPLSRKCTSTGTGTGTAVGERAFVEGLQSLGYRDGENIVLECRSAEGKYERLDAHAADLVKMKPAVFVASASPASVAAKRATSSIPIISVYTADPVSLGLVESLGRPGGNVTGISALASDYVAKSLQLLKEAAPRTSRVGVLGHGGNPTWAIYKRELEPAGRALGIALDFEPVQALGEIETALSALKRRGADALLVMHQPLIFVNRESIVTAVGKHRLPTMYGSSEAVELGGLLSYSVDVVAVYRRAAVLIDKVLKGAKPRELPVEQPTSFQLAVNLKTAKSLGLSLPPPLRLRADRVIE